MQKLELCQNGDFKNEHVRMIEDKPSKSPCFPLLRKFKVVIISCVVEIKYDNNILEIDSVWMAFG